MKNQEKLDEEWAALCAYEAEPCSTAVAEAEGNAECNRPGAALPYDHSRVILNDLANLNNSDYINASTIVSNLLIPFLTCLYIESLFKISFHRVENLAFTDITLKL